MGHVAQLCVDPKVRKLGLGRFLMLAALIRFSELECGYSTLTVTAASHDAEKLYCSLGYVELTRLAAYVWPNWPVRRVYAAHWRNIFCAWLTHSAKELRLY